MQAIFQHLRPQRRFWLPVARTLCVGRQPIAIAVHGGAWSIPDALKDANSRACQAAAALGYEMLKKGSSALEVVEAAVRLLEDEPTLNAGRGCSLNADGNPELDALVMDGSLRCGAVAGVEVAHPVSLAKMVLERSQHVLFAGSGAMAFAKEQGILRPSREELVTPEAEEEWRTWRDHKSNVSALFASPGAVPGDTVGCVALDSYGGMACATSTGGIVGKSPGRVGDTPLVGCGGYADNTVGAVSATGHGEAITTVTLSRLALWLVEHKGMGPQQATEIALATMQQRCGGEGGGGTGGLILVDKKGEVAVAFTTQRMAWATIKGRVREDALAMHGIDRS